MHVSTSICASAKVIQSRSTRDALNAWVSAHLQLFLCLAHIYANLLRQATQAIEVINECHAYEACCQQDWRVSNAEAMLCTRRFLPGVELPRKPSLPTVIKWLLSKLLRNSAVESIQSCSSFASFKVAAKSVCCPSAVALLLTYTAFHT